MRLVCFLVTFAAFAVLAGVSAAEPSSGELGIAWQAPNSCPDAAGLRARVEQRLGRSLDAFDAGGPIPIDIAIARDRGRFVARVDLRGFTVANDIRTLSSARCDELTDAVAVIVARVAGERVRQHRVAVADLEDGVDIAISSEATAPPVPRTWSLGVRVSGVSGIGVIPQVGFGAELAVALRRHDTLAEVAETKWLATGAELHSGQVDVGLEVTSARLGWRPEQLPLRAWLSAESGGMRGNGVGIADPQASGRWLAAGAGFGIAWQMTRWVRLVGSTEVLGAFERVRFSLGDGVVVYAPNPVSARASCGVEVGWQ
jgi:hypothetical protein